MFVAAKELNLDYRVVWKEIPVRDVRRANMKYEYERQAELMMMAAVMGRR